MMSELGRETVSAYAAAKGGLKCLREISVLNMADITYNANGIGPGYIERHLRRHL